MRFFRRRPKVETTSTIDGVGEVKISVDRSGKVPKVTVNLSRPAALGLLLEAKRKELGDTHPDTLHVAHRYAVALGDHPDHCDDAIELLEWLADVRADDPENRLLTLNDLSRLLQDSGHRARAEEVLRDAFAGWKRHRGRDDPNTLTIANNLAVVLIHLGRSDEADRLLRDTVARRVRILGPSDPDTVTSRNALAGTLRGSPARLAEAERMYRQILRDADGSAQADTVRHNLAAVLFHQGKLDGAESTYRKVLASRTRTLGADHPSTLSARGSLATVLHARGRVADAEREMGEVLDARQRVLGRHHPDSLETLADLAAILASRGRVAEALPMLTEALEGLRATHGPDHPKIAQLRSVLSQLREQR